jgi:hypothetical protein
VKFLPELWPGVSRVLPPGLYSSKAMQVSERQVHYQATTRILVLRGQSPCLWIDFLLCVCDKRCDIIIRSVWDPHKSSCRLNGQSLKNWHSFATNAYKLRQLSLLHCMPLQYWWLIMPNVSPAWCIHWNESCEVWLSVRELYNAGNHVVKASHTSKSLRPILKLVLSRL